MKNLKKALLSLFKKLLVGLGVILFVAWMSLCIIHADEEWAENAPTHPTGVEWEQQDSFHPTPTWEPVE